MAARRVEGVATRSRVALEAGRGGGLLSENDVPFGQAPRYVGKQAAVGKSRMGAGAPLRKRALGDITNALNQNGPVGPAALQHLEPRKAPAARPAPPRPRRSNPARAAKTARLKAAAAVRAPEGAGLMPMDTAPPPCTAFGPPGAGCQDPHERPAEEREGRCGLFFPVAQRQQDILISDIDAEDADDYLACSQYCVDIFRSYKQREQLFMADADYMSRQSDITSKMRCILIDWLVDVHLKFRLLPETLYLTVNVIDRFLSARSVKRQKLQLVGVTAMLIASKYEEIYAPETSDFVYISDRAYTKEEILAMEALILKVLAFDITVPSPLAFLGRALKAAGVPLVKVGAEEQNEMWRRAKSLASYALELSLQNYEMLKYPASERAAAATLLAGRLTGIFEWTMTAQHYSGYTEKELEECEQTLLQLLIAEQNEKNKLTAIKRKFSMDRYEEIAVLLIDSLDLGSYSLRCDSMDTD